MFCSFRSPAKKSSVAKILQFDSDPQQDVSSEGQSGDRPEIIMPSSLQPLIGQIAETAEEKYRLLEQRDKILRQCKYTLLSTCMLFQLFLFIYKHRMVFVCLFVSVRPKRTDLDMSKVFVGTCPDMCPEKERYMRETRNQLSVFELVPDTEKVSPHVFFFFPIVKKNI